MNQAVNAAVAGADFLEPAELRSVQRTRWRSQSAYVQARSGFYRTLYGARRVVPDDLEYLVELPFTDKQMLREDQERNRPFGSYLAADPTRIMRMHRTSGTTGAAMNLALSRADALMSAEVGGRAQTASGLGPGHRVVHCLNYQLWMGGYTDHAALEATGAMVIPYGVGNSRGLVNVIRELGVTAISCTPSYPAVLEQTIARHFQELRPKDLGLELGLFGGEPGLDDPAFRRRLEETWGFEARNSNYGVTDVLCNFAGQSMLSSDLHLVALDVLYPELIDPDTLAVKPWREGESGELVLTHLAKDCQPLIRFRTGDIITLTGTDRAACGRTAPRFRVIGRSDDMIVVRGINVFPVMVASVLNGYSALSGDYRIRLTQPPPYDVLPVEAELANASMDASSQAEHIEADIKRHIGVTARVRILPAGSLPRTEGKTRHVIRDY
ncbi:MAG: phenylacetate--CoA ligase family protein [Gammaproteobacteria bacterium]|nr:phenylacetate--CoA ligase family protein [Gammaproteobacteria bacterium]